MEAEVSKESMTTVALIPSLLFLGDLNARRREFLVLWSPFYLVEEANGSICRASGLKGL